MFSLLRNVCKLQLPIATTCIWQSCYSSHFVRLQSMWFLNDVKYWTNYNKKIVNIYFELNWSTRSNNMICA